MSRVTVKIPEETRDFANFIADKLRSSQQEAFHRGLERIALHYGIDVPEIYKPSLDYKKEFEQAGAGESVAG